jgi:hypothetical protein
MYDIVFISYQEPNAEENFKKLKNRFPTAKRVHGVKGIHQAHIAAANKCYTKMFWVVDGDAVIDDNFNFSFTADEYQDQMVHIWRSRNPINGLNYGYGGAKLLPKQLTIDMDVNSPDMTTSIGDVVIHEEVSNITAFNTDPFNTWKGAFRECVKLSSNAIKNQDKETTNRLKIWCSVGEEREYGKYALQGANSGRKFGHANIDNKENLKLINDFDWLMEKFKEETE